MTAYTKAGDLVLDWIGKIEAPKGFDTLYGNNQRKEKVALTSMTIAEVIKAGPRWTKSYGSSAAGRWQFMNATLKGMVQAGHANLEDKFTPLEQRRLAWVLLKRRGFDAFVQGKIGINEFAKRLSMEWASLPVLTETKAAHRIVKAGQSYYAGDGLNKSLVSTKDFNAILGKVYRTATGQKTTTKTETAIKVGTGVAVGTGVVEGAKQVNESVTDWKPVIDMVQNVGSYGGHIVFAALILITAAVMFKLYKDGKDAKASEQAEDDYNAAVPDDSKG